MAQGTYFHIPSVAYARVLRSYALITERAHLYDFGYLLW